MLEKPAMRVLVAEDSVIYQRLVGNCLRDWGFSPIVAKDGTEAWEVLRRPDAPKLVLLDWVLPDLDGIELCQRIRQAASEGSYSYIIVLTGKSDQKEMLEAMQAGADDYIVKPLMSRPCGLGCQSGSVFSISRRNWCRPGNPCATLPPTMA
jgi:DNA-binding response OmpR family regulator